MKILKTLKAGNVNHVKNYYRMYHTIATDVKDIFEDVKFLTEKYKDKFYATDLKLYELAYEIKDHELFNAFCDEKFQDFEQYVLNDFSCKLDYIGNTSSFYVTHEYVSRETIEMINNKENESLFYHLTMLSDTVDYAIYDDMINNKPLQQKTIVSNYNDIMDELETDVTFLYEALESFSTALDSMEEVYEYIESFKEYQLMFFGEWLEQVEEVTCYE